MRWRWSWRWLLAVPLALTLAAFGACGLLCAMADDTHRAGTEQEMLAALARVVPDGTEAGEARRRLTARGFRCDEPFVTGATPAQQWAPATQSPDPRPLPAGVEVTTCYRVDSHILAAAVWGVALIHPGGTLNGIVVDVHFRSI